MNSQQKYEHWQLEQALSDLPPGELKISDNSCQCCGIGVYCDHLPDDWGDDDVGAVLDESFFADNFLFETLSVNSEGETLTKEHLPTLDDDEVPMVCLGCANDPQYVGRIRALAARANRVPDELAISLHANCRPLVVDFGDTSDPWFFIEYTNDIKPYYFTAYDPVDGVHHEHFRALDYLLKNLSEGTVAPGYWAENEESYAKDTLGLDEGEELEKFKEEHSDHYPVNGGQGWISRDATAKELTL